MLFGGISVYVAECSVCSVYVGEHTGPRSLTFVLQKKTPNTKESVLGKKCPATPRLTPKPIGDMTDASLALVCQHCKRPVPCLTRHAIILDLQGTNMQM